VSTFPRVFLVVLDSVGMGALPDADRYGDVGSDTLGNIARHTTLRLPTLASWGLGRLVPALAIAEARPGAWGRMAEASPGKDSVTGHWEIAGLVLDRPFPTFPDGFPQDLLDAFAQRIGRHARQRRGVGNDGHSGAGRRARAHGTSHRVHVGR
jgi:phosphopentomutase